MSEQAIAVTMLVVMVGTMGWAAYRVEKMLRDHIVPLRQAHARCADALSTTQRKLSAIRDLINKPETVRKGVLASILDGDQ